MHFLFLFEFLFRLLLDIKATAKSKRNVTLANWIATYKSAILHSPGVVVAAAA
jgi:hypothetical protein